MGQALEVIAQVGGENDHVIQVDEVHAPLKSHQNSLHQALEGGGALTGPSSGWRNIWLLP